MLLRRVLPLLLPALACAAGPASWVPARWYWTDAASLELLHDTPLNCLLVKTWTPAFAGAAAARGVALLAVIAPGADVAAEARRAAEGKLAGIVLEGDFPDGDFRRAREAAPALAVIELPARSRMRLDDAAAVVGTYQGVWPGIQVLAGGAAKAAPTGSPWIETNTGFLRAARAWGHASVWLGQLPPAKTVITGERYRQAIADAAIAGGRWVVALDDDLAARLGKRDPAALRDWQRMGQMLAYFENHPEWRAMAPYARLAVVQDPASGALLSGGILDMLGARHTPVLPVPAARLTPDALRGATMAVNVEGAALPPEKQEVLKGFARSGGTLLTPAGGGSTGNRPAEAITLDKAETDRLNDVWHDVQALIGRRNLGARLFNVSGMLSNLLASADGKQLILHLVNYTSFPVENITVHMLGDYRHARLFTPEGVEKDLETYPVEGGVGVDIPSIAVCATLRLD